MWMVPDGISPQASKWLSFFTVTNCQLSSPVYVLLFSHFPDCLCVTAEMWFSRNDQHASLCLQSKASSNEPGGSNGTVPANGNECDHYDFYRVFPKQITSCIRTHESCLFSAWNEKCAHCEWRTAIYGSTFSIFSPVHRLALALYLQFSWLVIIYLHNFPARREWRRQWRWQGHHYGYSEQQRWQQSGG